MCSSKHDGLAGTRFGWGLIKDAELVKRVTTTVEKMVLSFSVDIQLRVLSSLQTVLSECLLPYISHNSKLMYTHGKRHHCSGNTQTTLTPHLLQVCSCMKMRLVSSRILH